MATLIKLSEYTKKLSVNAKLEDYDKVNETFVNSVLAYTDFITKDICLGHFVACDLEGNILQEPKFHYPEQYLKKLKGVEIEIALAKNKECEVYREALSRVVFKGFQYDGTEDNFHYVKKDDFVLIFDRDNGDEIMASNNIGTEYVKTIEDLIPFNLEVTDIIQQQFNL